MSIVIKANNVTLPSPDSISAANEIIWSENTGRSTTGKMIGDVIAEKETFTITWGILTRSEFALIKNNLQPGLYPFTIIEDGVEHTITQYRGTLTREYLGSFGETFYRQTQVSVIQQ